MKEAATIDNDFKEETANAFKFKIKDAVDMVARTCFCCLVHHTAPKWWSHS